MIISEKNYAKLSSKRLVGTVSKEEEDNGYKAC
jgi:hypothetical protein